MASSKPPLSRLSGQTQATPMDQEPTTPTSVVADSAPAPAASEPITPPATVAAPPAAAVAAVTWGDVLAWKHPIRSAFWFLAGLLMFGVVSYAMYGPHKITLVSGEGLHVLHIMVCMHLHNDLCVHHVPSCTEK